MRKRIYFLALFFCFTFWGFQVQSQCPLTGMSLFPASPLDLVNSTQQTVACAFGGQYSRWQVCAGATYRFSTCSTPNWDSQLTLYDDSGNFLAYSDDDCGPNGVQTTLVFTPNFSGFVRLLVTEYPCATNTQCIQLEGRRITPCATCPDDTLWGAGVYADSTTGRGNDCGFVTSPDVIYGVNIPCAGTWTFSICTSPFWDPRMYLGSTCCNADSASDDDSCGDGPIISTYLQAGLYYITVEGYDSLDYGNFVLEIAGSSSPANDACSNATAIVTNLLYSGSTGCANPDHIGTCGGVGDSQSGGVWYAITGDGNEYTADLCAGTTFDSRLRIFEGNCNALVCVTGNEDFCGLQSRVTWCTQPGVTYYILVHGNGTASGNFNLTVTEAPVANASFSGLAAAYCTTSPSSTLTPVTPGGTFSGPGISGSVFNPATAGVGTHHIVYTIVSGICTATDTQTVTVSTAANTNFTGLDVSYCTNSPVDTLFPVQGGGTFSGPGVSGNTFNPATAGSGVHTITYTINQGGGCVGTTSIMTTVNFLPNASFSGLAASYCTNAATATLSPSTPGGSFSGNGISGSVFDPATVSPVGTVTVTYTVTANGCTNSSSQSTNVIQAPNATFSGLAAGYCTTSPSATLTPVQGGGTFSGTGITGNSMNPGVGGTGTRTITYSITAGGCTSTSSQTTNVGTPPNASFSGLPASMCSNAAAVTLTPTTPGGTFSGSGVTGTSFNPATSGAGNITVTYTVTSSGCTNSSSNTVNVTTSPNATFTGLNATYCDSITSVTLTPVQGGGAFSGSSVSGNTYNPQASGHGSHTITYSITVGSCTSTSSQTTNVIAPASAAFSGLNATYCTSDPPAVMTATTPGGTFTGTAVSGTAFSPALAGVGTYIITYTISLGGCTTFSTDTTTVTLAPNASFSGLAASYCNNGLPDTLTALVPGGTFSGPGMNQNIFDPAVAAQGTHTITYSVSAGGCTSTSSQQVSVLVSPNSSFTGLSTTICQNAAPVTLVPAQNGGTFSGPGVSGTTFNPATAGPGLHLVRYTITAGGCTSINDKPTTVLAAPVIGLGNDTLLCDGDTLILNAGNPTLSWAWQTPSGNQNTMVVRAALAGMYSVTVFGSNGCNSRDTINITTGTTPLATIGINNAGNPIIQFTGTASGNPTGWFWEFGDGGTSPLQNTTHTYNADGTYYIRLIVSNACGADTVKDSVIIAGASVAGELTGFSAIEIYPNPSNGVFTLSLNGEGQQNMTVQITDLLGKEILRENGTMINGIWTRSFNISRESRGTYLVKVFTDTGSTTRRIVLH